MPHVPLLDFTASAFCTQTWITFNRLARETGEAIARVDNERVLVARVSLRNYQRATNVCMTHAEIRDVFFAEKTKKILDEATVVLFKGEGGTRKDSIARSRKG